MVQFSQSKVYSSSYVNNNGKESRYEKGAQSVNHNGKRNTMGFESKNGNLRELTPSEANKMIRQSQNTMPLKNALRDIDDVIGRFKTHTITNSKPKPKPRSKSYRKKRKKKIRKSGKNRSVSIEEENNTNQTFHKRDPPSFVELNDNDRTVTKKTRRKGRRKSIRKRSLKI